MSCLSHVEQLHHGTMALIDRRIGIGSAAGVGVRNADPTEPCAADDVRHPRLRKLWLEQGIIFGCIAMRPAIHRDGRDIASRIEYPLLQGAAQLIANIALES